jgi:hypothetical protein
MNEVEQKDKKQEIIDRLRERARSHEAMIKQQNIIKNFKG